MVIFVTILIIFSGCIGSQSITDSEPETAIESHQNGNLLVITVDVEAGSKCRKAPTDFGGEVTRCIYGIFGEERAGIGEMMNIADEKGVTLSFFVDVLEIYSYSSEIIEVMKYINSRGHDVQLHMHPSMINSTSWKEIQESEDWNKSGAIKNTYMNCWNQETADFWFSKSMDIFDEAGLKRPIAFRGGNYRYCDTIIQAMGKFNMTQSYNYNMYSSTQTFSGGYLHNFEWDNGVIEFPISYVKDDDGELRISSRIDESTWSTPMNETFGRFYENESSTRVMTMILHSFSFLSLNETEQYYLEDYSKLNSFRNFITNLPDEYQIVSAFELQDEIELGTISGEFILPLKLISNEC